MKQKNMLIEEIIEITGLTKEEIDLYKNYKPYYFHYF